mgnify:CR=1 FL=1
MSRPPLPSLAGACLAGAMLALLIAGPAAAFEIEPVRSDSGIEAWLVSEDAVPVVAVEALFHAGSHLDPAGKEGLADMTASLLTEGAGDLDSQAFAARMRDLNVSLSVTAGRDTIQIRMRTLSENIVPALDLVRMALAHPRFDALDIERVRAQKLSALARDEEDPDTIAFRTLFREALAGHAYANSPSGTPASIAAITVDDLRAYASGALARDNLSIAVVGDIDAATLTPLLEKTFGGLPATRAMADTAPVAPLVPGTTVVDRDNPQTVVVFAMDGMTRDDPDFIPAFVMNHILGGGTFVSRMFVEVREKRGLAYTAYTSLYPLSHGGLLIGYFASGNETAGEALGVARAQIADVAENGVTVAELDDARTFLTGSYALRFDSSSAIAGQLAAIQFEDLGLDYVERRNSLIEAVTLEDIERVAARLLRPDAMRIAAVGRPQGIAADIPAN